jgi:UDP-N-acetylmuramoylalanine--D-glutamate ligase
LEAYWAAKGQILAHQAPGDWAILNADDEWSRRYQPKGKVLDFSLEGNVEGAYLADGQLMLLGEPLLDASEVPLRGRHNLANVLAASATAHAAGIEREPMRQAVRAFQGVPHRLQTVAEHNGVRFVDDSIATAPERSIAALLAYDEPVVLIADAGLGGADRPPRAARGAAGRDERPGRRRVAWGRLWRHEPGRLDGRGGGHGGGGGPGG